jgi:uncharacterized protein YyaL (SSP411 family)
VKNQLQNQVSPYLLQHKDNPVHWMPWGEETLALAIKEDKPILVSIGYAACHWCHVMEHESFEDQSVAEIMNQNFICIKVDREERPDIDHVYMDAIHQMGLAGGWPLNVFLMPDQKPFYGGTYFPKNKWIQILDSIQSAFKNHRFELQQSADSFTSGLENNNSENYNVALDELANVIPDALKNIINYLDPVFGGIQKAPKFPLPSLSLFYESIPQHIASEINLFDYADLQLSKMAQGGIFDQVGGGFSRYSVDSEWFCPHFEKMLYDNAQLLQVYAKAYARSGNPIYKEVVDQIIYFLTNELKDDSGLFYSSLDADSEGIEGHYYVWQYEEINAILPYQQHADFYQTYQIKKSGNWEEGKIILNKRQAVLNKKFQFELDKLAHVRHTRTKPATDIKRLLAWNAFTGIALIQAAEDLNHLPYEKMAIELGEAMQQFHDENASHLLHQIDYAIKPIYAFLDDIGSYGLFLIHLYKLTGQEKYIKSLDSIINEIQTHHPRQNSLFSYQTTRNTSLISQKYEITDSVMPSSNSIVCELFLWSGYIHSNAKHSLIAKEMMANVIEVATKNPLYHANWLRIYSEWFENPKPIVKYNSIKYKKNELPELDVTWIPNRMQNNDFMLCIGDRCLSPCNSIEDLKVQFETI